MWNILEPLPPHRAALLAKNPKLLDTEMNKRLSANVFLLALLALVCSGCADALRRGMIDQTYISTARPSISITVNNMPLMASGQGTANLFWTGMMGGLNIDMWLAVYGTGGLAPLAITAQAETPQGWHWDGITPLPQSVDQGMVDFNGVTYQAYTYLVNPATDPFGDLVTGVKPDGQPQLWMARAFKARFNFNDDKIIMEYREPLPEGITDLSYLPLGYSQLLADFAQRAQAAFAVGNGPKNPANVTDGFIQGIQWKYMGQRFLGTASPDINFNNFN